MHWVVDDNLYIIITEGVVEGVKWCLLVGYDWREQLKKIENALPLFQCLVENACRLYIDKPIFQYFTRYFIMRLKQEGKKYIT